MSLCNYTDVYYNERVTRALEFMAATATADQVRHFSLRDAGAAGGDRSMSVDNP